MEFARLGSIPVVVAGIGVESPELHPAGAEFVRGLPEKPANIGPALETEQNPSRPWPKSTILVNQENGNVRNEQGLT